LLARPLPAPEADDLILHAGLLDVAPGWLSVPEGGAEAQSAIRPES